MAWVSRSRCRRSGVTPCPEFDQFSPGLLKSTVDEGAVQRKVLTVKRSHPSSAVLDMANHA
jgi:hypothetical protein